MLSSLFTYENGFAALVFGLIILILILLKIDKRRW